ncbi:MAG: hypothetical protein Q9222_004910 [Ikaeria aurantiellina]
MESRTKESFFQKPKRSAKLNFKDPVTGHAIELPSSNDRTPSDLPLPRPAKEVPTNSQPAQTKKQSGGNGDQEPQRSRRSKKANESTSLPKTTVVSTIASQIVETQVSTKHQTASVESKGTNSGVPASTKLKHSNTPTAAHDNHDPSWKPDIYAHAYVPEAFLAVNASPAILLTSTPVPAIDFAQYTSTFAGSCILPLLDPLQAPSLDGASPVSSIDNLTNETYEQHLSDCLVLDLEAQVPEIRTYDMYGVQLDVIDRAQETYSLHVPGLRENAPRVAFGDNIMVRQLVMDPTTKLPLAAPASGSTGYQISAVVVGVDRPKETLNLRINGFTPHLLMCNITFIVQTRWIKSLQRAVGSLATALKASQKFASPSISTDHTPADSTSSAEHDYGPIGTPIRSPSLKVKQDYFGSLKSPLKSPTSARNDYFGAIGTPVRTPRVDRQDFFGFTASSPHAFNDSSKPSELDVRKSRFAVTSYLQGRDIPISYSNRGWLYRMLFPNDTDGVIQKTLPPGVFKRSWFDRHLNHEQKVLQTCQYSVMILMCSQKAVDGVLTRAYGSVPFLVNGPPGTGKTKTMVEIVTQMAFDPNNEGAILLCAPSDSAADTLALRLRTHLEPKVMFRLNDFSRTFAEVPQEILPYCYVDQDIFNIPPLPELMSCKVVIATCRAADVLVQARVTNRDLVALESNTSDIINPHLASKRRIDRIAHLHWTALLVDEAAQATEPEMLIPLSVVAPPTACKSEPNPILVLAGDQYQLGPRVYDRSTTLSVSLFERLSNRTMYANHPLARKGYRGPGSNDHMLRPTFVNLTRNYRSHPAILAIPSSLFYADTLIPEARDTDRLEPWQDWRGRRWPVLFACNGGVDDCENIQVVGGGWFNVREAQKAITYAEHLLESGHIEDQNEICIMSPFRAQVNLLRKIARKAGFWGLNIGPMDAFQGLESGFVIICTTRTRTRFLEEDAVKGMGIVNEPKKFNVAVTRAKQGLVVIGNPWVLEQDPHWRAFMYYCWRNGLWQTDATAIDERMADAHEKVVNDWDPAAKASLSVSGLERALLYKEREPVEGGSKAVRRFMSERGEDEIWTLGRLAEAAIQDFDD